MGESTASLSTRRVELAQERRRFGYRRIKCLTEVDDSSRECVDIAVDHGMGGDYVVRLLDQAAQFHGYPLAILADQGPEFTSRAFMAWAAARGARHLLNDAGCPTQNAYIESFNGKFRDECLNEPWFQTLAQARQEVARWRRDPDEVRAPQFTGVHPAGQLRCLASPARWRCKAIPGDQVLSTTLDSLTQHWHR